MENRKFLTLEGKLAAAWPPEDWQEVTVVVAVSGGPDSVGLLRGLAALKKQAGGMGRLVVAHFDHHLRQDSGEDARFVAGLAAELKLPFEMGEATAAQLSPPSAFSEGVEAAVREWRYAFLQSAAEKVGARYVVTGHTADDQVETMLFNLLRGTGLAGLAGMPRARTLGSAASLIRPLLGVRRSEVLEYLREIKQNFRTDSSNASLDFTRNRIRHELLPMLREKFNPDVEQALGRLGQVAGDAQRLIERLADDLLDRCAPKLAQREVRLNIAPLATLDRHLVREMFVALWRRMGWQVQNMGFDEWEALAEMAAGPEQSAAKRAFPGQILVEREGNELVLSQQTASTKR
jgi:tRNA(Ile)-lysidine synthase